MVIRQVEGKFMVVGTNRFYVLKRVKRTEKKKSYDKWVQLEKDDWWRRRLISDSNKGNTEGSYWYRINKRYAMAQDQGLPWTKGDVIQQNRFVEMENVNKGIRRNASWRKFGYKY